MWFPNTYLNYELKSRLNKGYIIPILRVDTWNWDFSVYCREKMSENVDMHEQLCPKMGRSYGHKIVDVNQMGDERDFVSYGKIMGLWPGSSAMN